MWLLSTHRDEHVITAVLGGQREKFGALIERYLPVVKAIARAHAGAQHEIDDMLDKMWCGCK